MLYQKLQSPNIPAYLINLPNKKSGPFVEVAFPAGYFYAPQDKQEAAHLLEHYLYRKAFAAGITCSGSIDTKRVILTAELPMKNFSERLLKFLNIILNDPIDDEAVFEQEYKILHNELAGILDDPDKYAYRASLNERLPDQPPFTVSLEDFRAITIEDVSSYGREHRGGAQLFIGIHRPTRKFIRELETSLAKVPRLPDRNVLKPQKLAGQKQAHIPLKRNLVQLNMSWNGPSSFTDPEEQIAIVYLIDLLAKTDLGLVYVEMRDKEGLTYDVDYRVDNYASFGYCSLNFAVLPENVAKVREIVLNQVERIKQGDYPDSLIRKVRRYEMQGVREQWTGNYGRFSWIMTDILERKSVYTLGEWLAGYNKIDKNYLSAFAETYLAHNKLITVTIGDID